jgi:hypothetical protein
LYIAEFQAVLRIVGRIINLLREEAEESEVPEIAEISSDPGDDLVSACAEYRRADFIATLNKKDFPQRWLSAEVISTDEPLPTRRQRKRS